MRVVLFFVVTELQSAAVMSIILHLTAVKRVIEVSALKRPVGARRRFKKKKSADIKQKTSDSFINKSHSEADVRRNTSSPLCSPLSRPPPLPLPDLCPDITH